MVDFPDVIAQTQSVTSHPDGQEVQVEVIGPFKTPDFTRSLRARARALMAVGAVPTAVDTMEDLTVGEIKSLTYEEGDPIREKRGNIKEATLHTIIVNRE